MAESKINLDQGFNDAELEDIMNEIESLEKDFDMTSEVSSPKPDPIMEEIAASANSASDTDMVSVAEELLEQVPVAEVDPIDAALESALAAELEELAHEEGDLRVESSTVDKTALQGVIDQEVDELLKEREFDELGESPISEAEAAAMVIEPNVVEMAKPAPKPIPAQQDDFEPIMETHPMPNISPLSPASAPAPTEMSFSMAGTATVKLNFKISGQSIDLRVSESEGFVIEMGNGMKFTVPITQAEAWKKAS